MGLEMLPKFCKATSDDDRSGLCHATALQNNLITLHFMIHLNMLCAMYY